jgi:hypothetical protein
MRSRNAFRGAKALFPQMFLQPVYTSLIDLPLVVTVDVAKLVA